MSWSRICARWLVQPMQSAGKDSRPPASQVIPYSSIITSSDSIYIIQSLKMPSNKINKQASNTKFQTSTCGPGLVKVTTNSNSTPNSTPVKRAALGALGSNDIKGLTRVKVKSAPGTKASIVGESTGLSEIRATQDQTEVVSHDFYGQTGS